MRKHTGERPYKCEQCDYTAIQMSDLRTHMRTHTREKPYKCKQCNYAAAQTGNLTQHIMSKHGKKSELRGKRSPELAVDELEASTPSSSGIMSPELTAEILMELSRSSSSLSSAAAPAQPKNQSNQNDDTGSGDN